MQIEAVKKILFENKETTAFLLGNGVNRYYEKDTVSWYNLLLELWNKHSFDNVSNIPKGISFTEFYDVLEIQNASIKNFGSLLQNEVKVKMNDWSPSGKQNFILEKIKELDAPVLTTNFDELIPKSLGLSFFKLRKTKFTDFYPWSSYYSDNKLGHPNEGFGVWYLNGMLKYHRSIKMSLSHYMGNVQRARKLIHHHTENIGNKKESARFWGGYETWLQIWFTKSLFIVGLGLEETEVFMRWLLIERAKFFRRYPEKKQKGWYITKEGECSEGKRFFLKSVGIDVLELPSYSIIYESIWK